MTPEHRIFVETMVRLAKHFPREAFDGMMREAGIKPEEVRHVQATPESNLVPA
jgi:hypothetical protein